MSWDTTETFKDILLYAHKEVLFNETLQKGDALTLTLGVQLLTSKGAKGLSLEKNKEISKFKNLKTQKFTF